MSEVKEIVVVCDPFFRDIFEGFVSLFYYLYFWLRSLSQRCYLAFGCGLLIEYEESIDVDLKFAVPGKERQDSVHSELQVYTSFFFPESRINYSKYCVHSSTSCEAYSLIFTGNWCERWTCLHPRLSKTLGWHWRRREGILRLSYAK